MEVGDLVRKDGRLCLVALAGPQSVLLVSQDDDQLHLDADTKVEVVCNPLKEWPYLTLPVRKGVLKSIRFGTQELEKWHHWVKMDAWQMGGSLYLNPSLNLGYRDRLTLVGRNDRAFHVDVPRNFVPIGQQLATKRPEIIPPKDPNLFDHLMDDD